MYQQEIGALIERLKQLKYEEGYVTAQLDQHVRMLGVLTAADPEPPAEPPADELEAPHAMAPMDPSRTGPRRHQREVSLVKESVAALIVKVIAEHGSPMDLPQIRASVAKVQGKTDPVSSATVGTALSRLKDSSVLERVGTGRYQLGSRPFVVRSPGPRPKGSVDDNGAGLHAEGVEP